MAKLPKTVQIELNEKDVKENLMNVLNCMDRIRQESITNLGATDEQKTDYLRLTGELAGCVKTIIKENNLQEQFEKITKAYGNNPLLKNYDLLQEEFWQQQNSEFKKNLEITTAALLGEDFTGLSQSYHLFQALKLLYAKESERAEIFYTVLPFNTLLNPNLISNPTVASYLVTQLFSNVQNNGVGIEGSINRETFIDTVRKAGILYVDMPANQYETLRKEFPKTRLVKENNKKVARIIFDQLTEEQGTNNLTELRKYAVKHLGTTEDDLKRKVSNFYSYGKEFRKTMLQEMTGKSELEEVVEEENKSKKSKKKKKETKRSKKISGLLLNNMDNDRPYSDRDRRNQYDDRFDSSESNWHRVWGDSK